MAVLPNQLGIAVYSPRIDEHGNSVRGIQVCEDLSQNFGMHLFDIMLGESIFLRSADAIGASPTNGDDRTDIGESKNAFEAQPVAADRTAVVRGHS